MKQVLDCFAVFLMCNKYIVKRSCAVIIFGLISFSANAQTISIWESSAYLNFNGTGNVKYDLQASTGNPDFNGNNLGVFEHCQSLLVTGGEIRTNKCSGGNVTGGELQWRVWLTSGGPSGTFNPISLGFISDDGGSCGGDQRWGVTTGTTNIISGLAAGNYTLEVFSLANGYPGTVYSSNAGANYRANFTLTASGQWNGSVSNDWNNPGNWCGNAVPGPLSNVIIPSAAVVNINANTTANSITIQSGGSLLLNGAANLTISNNGSLTNNGNFNTAASTTGAVIFAGNATVSGICVFKQVVLDDGGVNFGTNASIAAAGSLTINSNGYVNTNAPAYDCGSTLIYNTGGAYGRGAEWSGFPANPGNVLITGNTILNSAQNSAGMASTCGSLTVDAGASFNMGNAIMPLIVGGNIVLNGNMTLSTVANGNLMVNGNWTRAAAGAAFTNNSRTVFFSGTANQSITRTGGGTEDAFTNLTLMKPSGQVVLNSSPGTNVRLSGTVVQLAMLDNAALNLNGQSFEFAATAANILVGNGQRNITGAAGSNLVINANTTITNTASGSLQTDAEITWLIQTVPINFGAALTTINGSLQLNPASYVDVNAPIYGTEATLIYNTGSSFPYDRRVEWSRNVAGGPGFPYHVIVTGNTVLIPGGNTAPDDFRNMDLQTMGDVNIHAGSAIYMDYSGKAMNVPLKVGGALNIEGSLSASTVFGADIYVAGNWNRTGIFNHNNRAVFFDGSTDASLTALNGQAFPYAYLTKTDASLTLLDDVFISREMGLNSGALNMADNNISILSSATATARVAPVTATIDYSGTGRFFIERYIKTKAKWQLLSIAADSAQTIKNAWAEGMNAGEAGIAGMGTHITGPAGTPQLDVYTPAASMKYFDEISGSFKSVTKKDTAIYNPRGYYVFVRGDRYASFAGPNNTTVLRTKGKLFINPSVNYLLPGKTNSVGNPLASEIDLRLLSYTGGAGLSTATKIYLWDPTLSGAYSVGGYQTLTYNGSNFTITPGNMGAGNYPASGAVYNKIQSGQAFYVDDPAVTGIVFPEAAKTNETSITATRTVLSNWQYIDANLLTTQNQQTLLLDGVAAHISDDFLNVVDNEDAKKYNNAAENVSFYRNGQKLSVERHAALAQNDTFYLRSENLRQQQYQWQLQFRSAGASTMQAWLGDRFLQTETPLYTNDSNHISFEVISNAASAAGNRFYIVMKTQQVLPVHFIGLSIKRNTAQQVQLQWQVSQQLNILHYTIERSSNGIDFTALQKRDAENSTIYDGIDDNPLPGASFYRIKATGIAGDISYSSIEKLAAGEIIPSIVIAPNPVKNKQINIRFTNQSAGIYKVQLTNMMGQTLLNQSVKIIAATQIENLLLPAAVAAGNYRISLLNAAGILLHSEMLLVE